MLARMRAFLAGALCVGVPTGCAGHHERTVWPPCDWYLEVRSGTFTEHGYEPGRCFQAWADGYALYREAEGRRGDAPAPWPAVWSRASAWRMRPESTRLLARLVHGAGLEAAPAESGTTSSTPGPVVAVYTRAFGNEVRVVVRDRATVPMSRLLYVVNSYLPEGESVTLPDMTGDREERHLTRVPAPLSSRADTLELYDGLIDRQPGGDGFAIDVFALALALGDRERAERALARIDALERGRPLDHDPGGGREPTSELLRAQLDR